MDATLVNYALFIPSDPAEPQAHLPRGWSSMISRVSPTIEVAAAEPRPWARQHWPVAPPFLPCCSKSSMPQSSPNYRGSGSRAEATGSAPSARHATASPRSCERFGLVPPLVLQKPRPPTSIPLRLPGPMASTSCATSFTRCITSDCHFTDGARFSSVLMAARARRRQARRPKARPVAARRVFSSRWTTQQAWRRKSSQRVVRSVTRSNNLVHPVTSGQHSIRLWIIKHGFEVGRGRPRHEFGSGSTISAIDSWPPRHHWSQRVPPVSLCACAHAAASHDDQT